MPARRTDFIRLIRRISKSIEEIKEFPEKVVAEPLEAEVKKTLLEKLYSFSYRGDVGREELENLLGVPLDEYVKSYTAKLLGAHREDGRDERAGDSPTSETSG